MRFAGSLVIGLLAIGIAQADFSYTTTRKSTGGMMAQMANSLPATTHNYLKGQKTKVDTGDIAIIIDLGAQTVTNINAKTKTYTVKPIGDMTQAVAGADIHAEVKETGAKKVVNGFNCSQVILTMDMDMPQARQMGKMQMEMELWISPDVPGIDQLKAFYKQNANFPWSALAGGANSNMQQTLAEVQKKMASLNGIPVEQVMRVKAPAMAASTAAQMKSAGPALAQARARLEAMVAQGGPGAEQAKKMLASMPGGGAASSDSSGSGSNALIETTMDSSDFSTAAIPDSVFAIPAGFTQIAK